MATQNSWNNTINNAKGGITLNAQTNAINIGSDAYNNTIGLGTGAAAKAIFIGSTSNTGDMNIFSGSGIISIAKGNNGGGISIGTDSQSYTVSIANIGTKTLNIGSVTTTTTNLYSAILDIRGNSMTIGTSGLANTVSFGNTIGASTTTLQSGSGALNVTSTNGTMTINSGTGTISIGNDATAATYNFATGAGAKAVTLGTTNSTSSLALKYGTADFTLASATGTVMSALDTGEITYPLQPAFLGYLGTQADNVTGNGTVWTLGSGTALTEVFDQNNDFNTNGTFTAPVTGRYMLGCNINFINPSGGGTEYTVAIVTSNRTYYCVQAPTRSRVTNLFGTNGNLAFGASMVLCDMDAADTATVTVTASNGTLTSNIGGSLVETFFSGYLVC